MTNSDDDAPAIPPRDGPPGVPGPDEQVIWYRRTWVIVIAAIAVVIGASVLVDLPRPVSTSDDIASQTASLKEINTDVAPCSYAITETFQIHHDQLASTLTPPDRQAATKMLTDDQTACSFTNGSVFDLTNNIQVQDTAAGKYVDRMLSVTTTWVTSDALAAVEDIQALYLHPGDPAKTRDLATQEKLLAHDRGQAILDIQQADALLRTHLPDPNLPALPYPSS
jgi:hypothetical protein